MSSRKSMTRSSSDNGRSGNGDNLSGRGRPGGCSYISNVRPENRNTLCSMIAQLTEETQPSFETTLKSRAVSENCNVKFSCVVAGYPAPQVIWYKNDVQLDRYCGLPKYELFRNGENHSLHIYNCTTEDAAIYQVSATNNKGIVACSGVLEVGEMNEFKIHQLYFANLKQKAENRQRETEGKENQEPQRCISPDRTQRKRRSTMDDKVGTPSSREDEGDEESHQLAAVETEPRLQEAPVEEVKEKPAPITNGAVPRLTNGQAISENGIESVANRSDAAQKMFAAHQPKTPFIKKKIKISNSGKVAKSGTPGERASEARPAREESTCLALSFKKPVQSERHSYETTEVENIAGSSSVKNSVSTNLTECQESVAKEECIVERHLKDENTCGASQKKQLKAPAKVAGTEGKQTAKQEKETSSKATAKQLEKRNQSTRIISKQEQKSSAAVSKTSPSLTKEAVFKTQKVPVTDAVKTSNTSTASSLTHQVLCESRTALPKHPCGRSGDQLPEKETSSCQKNTSEWTASPLSEVPHFPAGINMKDAPVFLPFNQHTVDPRPSSEKTPSEEDVSADGMKIPSINHGVQAAFDEMTRDALDHSRGSNEVQTALFTDLQKSQHQSCGRGENPTGCDISSSSQKSQMDGAIKVVKVTEIQVVEKTENKEVDEHSVLSDRTALNEKVVEMKTENAAQPTAEATERQKTKDTADEDTGVIVVDSSNEETEYLKMGKEIEAAIQLQIKTTEDTNLSKLQIQDFQEVQQPVTKVLSVAELLRSQIKAFDSMLPNSRSTIQVHADDSKQPKTDSTEKLKDIKDKDSKGKGELKKSKPDRKTESVDDIPPKNIKETLLEVFHKLNEIDQEQMTSQTSTEQPAVRGLEKPIVIPPTFVVETDTTTETTRLHECNKKFDDTVDCLETGPSNIVTSCQEPVTPMKAGDQYSNGTLLEHTKDKPAPDIEAESNQKLTPEIEPYSKSERGTADTPLEDGSETQEIIMHLKQDSSDDKEWPRTDSLAIPTPQASPSIKKEDLSPIPSATAQELASGARRKIMIPKVKPEEVSATVLLVDDEKGEGSLQISKNLSPSPSLSRRSPLLHPPGEQSSPTERYSPLNTRKMASTPTQEPSEETTAIQTDVKPPEKDKLDPFKAPQVIRKIRAETFADTSGHVKLWCQFFNVLSDSIIKWYRNEEEIAQIKRNVGDESKVNLAIVQASSRDCGVYKCTITNEYGTDSTDCLLSADILIGMSLREDLSVGEEIEMTPMMFSKGVADSGVWGNKLFGRIMMQESHIGDGCSHKVWRAKVIYGLEPVFESGNTCIIKGCNPINYGGKGESCLLERNLDLVKQECKIHNLVREYCKIFSAEARVMENFGPCLEVIPVYLMYRPANTIPYATVEADLSGVYQKYCEADRVKSGGSEIEQKCCALQHWIFQWTNGNLLLTRLEGVDTKITRVGIAVKSAGHQGLPIEGNPKHLEQFVSQHQCNYFCGLLSLRSLKVMDSLSTPTKPKGSRSPLLQRKMAGGSSSPQTARKAGGSPRLPRKIEHEGRQTPTQEKAGDATKVVMMA